MSRKARGFPLEYYPGEILTEREARINRKMFLFRAPNVSVMFLKFLKFTTSLDYKTEIFDGDSYRIILFRVKDFLDVSHSHYNSQDEYYKMQKTRDFLRDLQQNLFIRCFTDDYFKLSLNLKYISVRNLNVG